VEFCNSYDEDKRSGSLTINVPLILKVRGIVFFCGQNIHIMERNLGVKKVSAPSKNRSKCPLNVLPAKEKISRVFKISGTLIVILLYLNVTGSQSVHFDVRVSVLLYITTRMRLISL
jgi:hypothetical protein